jgi:hypothetical protein
MAMQEVLGVVYPDGIMRFDGIDQGSPTGMGIMGEPITQPVKGVKNA